LAVLPAADRAFGLFPVLIFLAASMSAAFASVADGATTAAYAWLLLLLILFGPLTCLRLGGILLLAVGALRLHEAMVFLGPILIFACLWRRRWTAERDARIVLLVAGLLIATGCAIAVHDVLHPRIAANRTSLIQDVVNLRWLFTGRGQVNPTALAGLLGILGMPVVLLRPCPRTVAMGASLIVFAGLAMLALAQPPYPATAFAARDNACLLTAPAMVVLLMLKGGGRRLPAVSALFMAFLGLAVATADATATAGWLSYTGAMRMALVTGHGVVPWRDALAKMPSGQAAALHRYAWPWTTPLMSLWLATGPMITTIITNPPGVTWQPFDPDALKNTLARNDIAPTRDGVVALLGKKRGCHPRPGTSRQAEPATAEMLRPLDRQRQARRIGDTLGAAEEESLGIGLVQFCLRGG
jgi:hypothetical protein